jgi:hypothetical protein
MERETRAFSWPRELWTIAGLAVLAAGARVPWLLQADAYFDSDSALGALMARAIAHGERGYLMCEGQDYLGALEAYCYAPWVAAWPGDPRGPALAQILLVALLVVPLLYRCCWLVGARPAAIVGTLSLAVGSPWLLTLTTCAPMGYLTNLIFGLAILLAGHALLEQVDRMRQSEQPLAARRWLLFGWLSGAGFWNNPQVVVFIAAVILALWSRGALFTAPATRQRALWQSLVGRSLQFAIFGTIVALPVLLWLPAAQLGKLDFGLLTISIGRPEKYFPRGVMVLVALLALVELILTTARWRLISGALLFAGSATLGAAPLLAYQLTGHATGVGGWMRWQLHTVPEFAADLLVMLHETFLGAAPSAAPCADGWFALQWACAIMLAWLTVTWLLAHARELGAIVACKGPISSQQMLLWPALLLLCVAVLRGGVYPRYLLAAVGSFAVLLGWGAAQLWAGGSARRVVLLLALGALHCNWLFGIIWWAQIELPQRRDPHKRALVEQLVAAGIRHASGNFWVAFELTFLADQRLEIGCSFDPGGNMHRFPHWLREARRQPLAVRIFDLDRPEERLGWQETQAAIGQGRLELTRSWHVSRRYLAIETRSRPQ